MRRPVWINVGGIGGIGLQGPGATNAARTLIAALLHALPATTVVSDRYTVAALLGAHPHQRPCTGNDHDRAPTHRYRRVHVVDHPRDVLDYAHAHLHRHAPTTPTTSTTSTAPTAPTAGASPAPLVLVLPSPTNPATRGALAATLRRGRPHGVVALLHGPWPLGWNCLWVPRTPSPHATWTYSWMRPPSRSRRSGRTVASERGGVPPAGGL